MARNLDLSLLLRKMLVVMNGALSSRREPGSAFVPTAGHGICHYAIGREIYTQLFLPLETGGMGPTFDSGSVGEGTGLLENWVNKGNKNPNTDEHHELVSGVWREHRYMPREALVRFIPPPQPLYPSLDDRWLAWSCTAMGAM